MEPRGGDRVELRAAPPAPAAGSPAPPSARPRASVVNEVVTAPRGREPLTREDARKTPPVPRRASRSVKEKNTPRPRCGPAQLRAHWLPAQRRRALIGLEGCQSGAGRRARRRGRRGDGGRSRKSGGRVVATAAAAAAAAFNRQQRRERRRGEPASAAPSVLRPAGPVRGSGPGTPARRPVRAAGPAETRCGRTRAALGCAVLPSPIQGAAPTSPLGLGSPPRPLLGSPAAAGGRRSARTSESSAEKCLPPPQI